MAQSSYQVQSQAQIQSQTLSPMQVLAIKLTELPTVEFEERVRAELLENPALDEGREETPEGDNSEYASEELGGEGGSNEDYTLGDYRTEDDIPDYKLQERNRSAQEVVEDIPFSDTVSFYETLIEQLNMRNLSEQQYQIGEYIIGSLDDDGLLRKDIDKIVDELTIYQGCYTDEEEVLQVLAVIQDFDPAGIGARNLQECLLLQIRRKEDSDLKRIEEEIISRYCDDFTRKNKERIIQLMGITEAEYTAAYAELVRLNPRPGSSMGEVLGKNIQQITPDFIVETDDEGEISVMLNSRNVPELHLSKEFVTMLEEHSRNKDNQTKESKDAFLFLKQKVDAAQGFINAIKQRQQTLMSTMNAIVHLQNEFFREGDEASLKPMILKDVAEIAHLDISTISRVSNSKYVQTNFGIFSLKYFFSDSYTTDSGEEVSVREMKRYLKECVENEDKNSPLTDDELAEMLKVKGYPIARRTIAKYRKQLNIPIARLRR